MISKSAFARKLQMRFFFVSFEFLAEMRQARYAYASIFLDPKMSLGQNRSLGDKPD
ncbi:hypothetical protein ABIE64_002534 [Thalassospira sp. MBR-102]|jgi:hypothetical protein|uniref:hypothetical protein n=1 Tax=Hyphomonas sp. UBA4508 TaxID=1946633 RepID=UPI0008288243|nr:hypothetical protein [Hyphomonas sp. UBA4508]OCK06955.1 hypothetical protein KO164_1132 [Thalassospira sp. KO164]PXX28512.1 hypothetical protein C7967_11062 [Thalassospira sp. 11-3]SED89858.1 hypothetical protein SAMN04515623_1137 [Thalassospira permensis]|tara:strand:- start:1335 stop:1502 length:168 start_codon:yes stop_codon:yes gene_type:complete